MSEHEIQASFFDVLRLYEKKYPTLRWVYAVPNGGKRHVSTAVKLKREGVKSGVWDVHIPIPMGSFRPGAYIEFKAGKNKLTSAQKEFKQALERHGYEFEVCYSMEQGIRFINAYLSLDIPI